MGAFNNMTSFKSFELQLCTDVLKNTTWMWHSQANIPAIHTMQSCAAKAPHGWLSTDRQSVQ
jgi:uncharacterized protein YmfQ (DUF2313 family)